MPTTENFATFDDFLGHSTFERSGGNFLKTWKKKGQIDVWLHRIRVPQRRYTHQWHKIEPRENKDTKRITKEVWGDDFGCHEEESVLKKKFRDDSGQRKVFPEMCPSCRLDECVYQLVTTGKLVINDKVICQGKLSWTEPMFIYEGSDSAKNVILHAGGIYNGYKDVAKDTEDADALREAGIYLKTAWRENALAKLKYLFAVVDNADVGKGVQITEEVGLLGDKVRAMVAAAKESLADPEKDPNGDRGNPMSHPYAVRWKFLENEQEFSKKYEAIRMESIRITPPISELINSKPGDWFAAKLKPGDTKTLRARLERHASDIAKKILPWDWIFDVGERADARDPEGASESLARREEEPEPTPVRSRRKVVPQAPPPKPKAPEPEMLPCDDCQTMMLATASKCPKPGCGAVYQIEDPPAKAGSSDGGKKAPKPEPADDPVDDDDLPF